MALAHDLSRWNPKGSTRWFFKVVNGDGSAIAGQDWQAGSAIKESGFKDDTAEETREVEDGTEQTAAGKRSVEWSGMFAQNDSATKALMPKTLRNKYVSIIKEESVLAINGVYPYLWIPVAVPIPSTDRKLPGGDIPFKFKPLPLSSSASLDLSTITGANAVMAGNFTGTISLPAGESYLDFDLSS